MAAIETAKVNDRRQLHFSTLEDILAEVDRLAQAKELRALGNWSAGQVLQHLAVVMNVSIDGFPHHLPGIVRFFVRLVFKKRFLTMPMSAGFALPKKLEAFLPPPTTWEEGLANFRAALRRLQSESKRAPHGALGPMTADEWTQLHCRHSELHLSFLVPLT